MINEEVMLAGHKFIAILAIILFRFYSGIRSEFEKVVVGNEYACIWIWCGEWYGTYLDIGIYILGIMI